MEQERKKWLSFLALRDAFSQPGCAVCQLVIKSSERLLGSLFHEYVTDAATRAWLQAANGFCNWHAWLAMRMPDTESGLGMIYETILEVILKRFRECERLLAGGAPANGLIEKLFHGERDHTPRLLEQTGECQICFHAAESEDLYLNELLTWFDDEEMRTAFDQSFGLCLPHLDLTISRYRTHENLPRLVEAERLKCESLFAELGEFVRKLDYQYAGEPRGAEQDSWHRAVELCAGKARLFGHQMPRYKA